MSMDLNCSESILPASVSKDLKAFTTVPSSSCSPEEREANILRRVVKLIGFGASATIESKSSSVPGRPISAKVARRSSFPMRPSLSLSMTEKPSLNSATWVWVKLSKMFDPAFLADFFFCCFGLGMVVVVML
ncbi:unnamed protein product [Meganyctiphanes norvegica]|uniref:Uncharacterized protein n=1 Tax=Meganyctiphanes norvegica TaxID=48144 RepID=A0AAV2RN86_MEGNR